MSRYIEQRQKKGNRISDVSVNLSVEDVENSDKVLYGYVFYGHDIGHGVIVLHLVCRILRL